MPITTPRPLARRLLELPMAPFQWVERARGRWRLALLTLYSLILAMLGVIVARPAALRNLPDIGDPFDVDAFQANRPALWPDDASVLFETAGWQFKEFPVTPANQNSLIAGTQLGWSKANPAVRAWVASNREALATWRRAAGQPAATHRPGHSEAGRLLEYYHFGLLVALETRRLMDEGDMAGAWAMIRANLRAARHLGALEPIDMRFQSAANVARFQIKPQFDAWAADPRVDAAMLRRALVDVQALDTIPDHDLDDFKDRYIEVMRTLDDPPEELRKKAHADLDEIQDGGYFAYWSQFNRPLHWVRWFLWNEPERSRRVARLVFAHWLAVAEMTEARQSKLVEINVPRFGPGTPLVYFLDGPKPDTTAPSLPGGLSADALRIWYDSTLELKHILPSIGWYRSGLTARTQLRYLLVLGLASELYAREHGGQQPPTPGALVGPYLKSMPEYYFGPYQAGNATPGTAPPP